MSPLKVISLALAALMLSGCSLVWTANRGPDASTFDANDDANVVLDAGIDGGPDAFRRVENCSVSGDEDNNGLANCDDPACYGTEQCCRQDSAMLADTANFATRPMGWNVGGAASVDGTSPGLLRFGAGGSFVRSDCIPLVEGVRVEVPIVRVAASAGVLRLVLSPAAASGPRGFVDEVAIEFGGDSVQVFRAGMLQPMPTPDVGSECTGDGAPVRTATSLSLPGIGQTMRLRVEVRPGLAGGRSVMLANVFLDTGTYAACMDPQPIVRDAVIDVRDLVSTGACSGTPGLFLALEGKDETFAIRSEGSAGQLLLSTYECASPGVFRIPSTPTLSRAAMGTRLVPMPPAVEPAAGGMGAPSLRQVSAFEWVLSFDGSEQDRASEVFAPIRTSLFQSSTGMLGGSWNGRPGNLSQPVTMFLGEAIPGSLREPYQLNDDLYFSALVRPALDAGIGADAGSGDAGVSRPTFAIFRANARITVGEFNAPELLPLSGCAEYREVAVVGTSRANSEFFYRCDSGASSTVGMSWGSPPMRVDSNILGTSYASRRVRALDVLRTGAQLALWVLFEGSSGTELHLFLSRAAPGMRPTFTPFVGNPVLVEAELREAGTCTAEPCSLSSFAVARNGTTLHFYFVRRRGTNYEFALRTQPAPPSLR